MVENSKGTKSCAVTREVVKVLVGPGVRYRQCGLPPRGAGRGHPRSPTGTGRGQAGGWRLLGARVLGATHVRGPTAPRALRRGLAASLLRLPLSAPSLYYLRRPWEVFLEARLPLRVQPGRYSALGGLGSLPCPTDTASPPANLKALDSRSSPHFQLLHVCLAHPLRIIVPKYTSAVEMMKSRPRAESSPRVGVLCFLCSRRRTRPSTRGGG
ncbi:uncharacterized protein LOC121479821 [Vulpes lagopus]|uniref:uncharacterized protein LOC121479821 n=1 Tax=Vulpes lagopus TaxID=494514 RepID=UPI001BC9334B|nr:uncharacterized protein LOC121479821 [Vulpes lagopus]